MDIRLLIYVLVLLGAGIGIWIVRELLVEQADEHLPDDEKIRRTIWSRTGLKAGEMSRAWQVHSQFLPGSSLRSWYVALWILAVFWMLSGLQLLNRESSPILR